MRKVTALTTAFCLLAGASFAADTYTATIVLPDGNVVAPDTPLAIEIHATVTNDSPGNQGLAYFSTDFTMSGPTPVELATAMDLGTPPPTPMDFFARDLGYDAEYGGTGVGDDLLQAGGALNTIGNDPSQEPFLPFPSAEIIPLNVAHSDQIVLSGTITFPIDADGTYTLSLQELLANVISLDAVPGSFAIYPVEAANTVAGDPVDIIVGGSFCIVHGNPDWVREDPGTHVAYDDWAFSAYIDPKVESTNGADLDLGKDTFTVVFSTAPFGDAGGVNDPTTANVSVEVTAGAMPNVASVTKNGNALTVELDRIITLQEWTTLVFDVWNADGVQIDDGGNEGEGVDECARLDVGFLPGDVNNSSATQPQDLSRWIVAWNAGQVHPSDVSKGIAADYTDISRNGIIQPQDLSREIAALKGQAPFTQNWRNVPMNNTQP